MGRSTPYSTEEIQGILFEAQQGSPQATTSKYGVHSSTYYNWKERYTPAQCATLVPRLEAKPSKRKAAKPAKVKAKKAAPAAKPKRVAKKAAPKAAPAAKRKAKAALAAKPKSKAKKAAPAAKRGKVVVVSAKGLAVEKMAQMETQLRAMVAVVREARKELRQTAA